MHRSRIVAATLCAGLLTSTVVAPAQALESKVKNGTCTIELSISEKDKWQKATSQPHDMDEAFIMPFVVDVAKAKAVKADFANKMEDLELRKASDQDLLNTGGVDDEDMAKRLRGNIAVITAMEDLRKEYDNALTSCANNSGYKTSDKQDNNSKNDGESTSSNMDDATMYTLLGLLGVAALTALAAFVANGGLGTLPFF